MAKEKDISEKTLESYNDVFADILNVAVLKEPGVIRPEDLEDAAVTSQLKLGGILTEQERDTAKRWKKGTITLAFLGLENQTEVDWAMPLRGFSYDGAVYKQEVNQRERERRTHLPLSPFYPSITVVLYFGLKPWTGPRTLMECFPDMPDSLRRFVPDYQLPIVEVAFLTPEEVAGFQSDFGIIADYLVQKRRTGVYTPSPAGERMIHVDETLKLMGAITGDRWFEKAVNALPANRRREGVNMYSFLDDVRNGVRMQFEGDLREKDRLLAEQSRRMVEQSRRMAEQSRMVAELNRDKGKLEEELRNLKARFGMI